MPSSSVKRQVSNYFKKGKTPIGSRPIGVVFSFTDSRGRLSLRGGSLNLDFYNTGLDRHSFAGENESCFGTLGYGDIGGKVGAVFLPRDRDFAARSFGDCRGGAVVGKEAGHECRLVVGYAAILHAGDIPYHPVYNVGVHMMIA